MSFTDGREKSNLRRKRAKEPNIATEAANLLNGHTEMPAKCVSAQISAPVARSGPTTSPEELLTATDPIPLILSPNAWRQAFHGNPEKHRPEAQEKKNENWFSTAFKTSSLFLANLINLSILISINLNINFHKFRTEFQYEFLYKFLYECVYHFSI